jgi:glycine/D-amino acid oxidase-like deaminating enzyme
LKGATWTHGWNSRLAITADHYPHVHEPAENLLMSLGCNGRGVALSTAMGRELARRLVGARAAEIDMPITDIKPIAMHAFWPLAVRSVVLAGRLRDRLGI